MSTDFIVFILSVISIGSIAIGFSVYARERTNPANMFFAIFAISAGLWGGFGIIKYYAYVNWDYVPDTLYFTKFATAIIATAFFSLCLFSSSFPQGRLLLSKKMLIGKFILYMAVIVAIFIPGAVIVSDSFIEEGGVVAFQSAIEWGPFYWYLFAPFLFTCFLVGMGQLIKNYREAKDAFQKSQILYVSLGLGLSAGPGLILWFFLPQEYFWVARFSVFIFIALTAYAVLRHKFFTFRTAAAEFFTLVIGIFLFAQTVASFGDWREFAISGGLLVFVGFFGSLLITSVKHEVEHRRKLEEMTKRLTLANEHLEELDAIKSQFLSFASHQVKTPMTIIKGYVSLLQDDVETLSDEEIKDMSGKIRMATDRTISLVNNLLDLRRIEEGQMEYHMDAMDIVPLIRETFEDLRIVAENKKLSFTRELPDEAVSAQVDVIKIRQVFLNLIENALKYTNEGWVDVRLEKESDRTVLFTVRDSGLGMSDDAKKSIFKEIYRDSVVVKAIKGTGFGLYIAKHVVDAHGGEIWAESEGEGKGSAFFVRLPLDHAESVEKKDVVEN